MSFPVWEGDVSNLAVREKKCHLCLPLPLTPIRTIHPLPDEPLRLGSQRACLPVIPVDGNMRPSAIPALVFSASQLLHQKAYVCKAHIPTHRYIDNRVHSI